MKLEDFLEENSKHRDESVSPKLEELVESIQNVLEKTSDEVISTEHQYRMSVEPELADRVRHYTYTIIYCAFLVDDCRALAMQTM